MRSPSRSSDHAAALGQYVPMRYLSLRTFTRTSRRSPPCSPRSAGRGTTCSSSAISSATARRRTKSSIASASSTRSPSSAAITTRPPAASRTAATSTRSRALAALWTHETLTAANRQYLKRAAGRARSDRRARRNLPRLAVRRRPLHLRRRGCAARARRERRAALPVRRTRTCRSSSTTRMRSSTGSCRSRTRRPSLDAAAGRAVPGQRRLGRPAARRRSAGGIRRLRSIRAARSRCDARNANRRCRFAEATGWLTDAIQSGRRLPPSRAESVCAASGANWAEQPLLRRPLFSAVSIPPRRHQRRRATPAPTRSRRQ